MLLLFDIDGTLLHTTGCGMACILAAGKECFGQAFSLDGISVAGRLDPLIFADAFARNAIPDTPHHHSLLRTAYLAHLAARLETTAGAAALPGALQLLDSLAALQSLETPAPANESGPAQPSSFTIALLTGNFKESAHLKLARCGIAPQRFHFGVFGDQATIDPERPREPPRREDLVPTALRRVKADYLPAYASAHSNAGLHSSVPFTIIGDTPHDVRCATVHGGRCLAVATGQFSRASLLEAGAHRVVDDLTATDDLVDWLTSTQR